MNVALRDPDTGTAMTLAVRAFTARDSVEAAPALRPIIAALADQVPDDPAGWMPDPAAVSAAWGRHRDALLALLARAAGRDAAWLGRLDERAGDALHRAFWRVNGAFVCERIGAAVIMRTEAAGALGRC